MVERFGGGGVNVVERFDDGGVGFRWCLLRVSPLRKRVVRVLVFGKRVVGMIL